MDIKDEITLTWCEKHQNWGVTNCPDCMVDSNEESIKRAGIQEVVEWIKKYKVGVREEDGSYSQLLYTFWEKELQAFLKEHGLDAWKGKE